ncbi:glycosyltransferase family 4 protein [Luminiphilus sp.]|nr:glycosyltransferase family 4 protein [Luminiphilus sp.]
MHDLIWRELPELFSFRYRALRRVLFGLAIKSADSIVTISDGSARAISKFYPQCKNKIIFHGIGDSFKNENSLCNQQGVDGEDLIEGQYLLTVGRHEPRKNYDRLVRAYGESKISGLMKLVIVGYVDKNFETQHEFDSGVICLTDVSDSQLSNIYRNCTAFIFPSLAEGYGLPVREALQYKKPVLVSNTFPCKPTLELCAEVFDPESTAAISRSIDNVMDRILCDECIGPTEEQLAMLPTWQSHVTCMSTLF